MEKIESSIEKKNYKPILVYDEMSSSYLSYAMSVIVSRALPDVRDGLKPVHRRIIYAMYKGGFDWSKQFRKSARVVGDVIGKYHPHGDQAVYDALVRLTQNFSMSLPLIDGQGNFGSIDGDPPAAMRYTETKLAKASQFLIDDIEKNTIEFRNNYDDTEKEPTVLPSQFPNLLVNGAGGIAVGMATSIPPHNLSEIIDGTIAFINNKDITISQLMKKIPGPDFPTGGVIIGHENLKQGYNKGRGSIKIRGLIEEESLKNGKERLVIKSIPYQVNKSVLNERIAELAREKKIEGITQGIIPIYEPGLNKLINDNVKAGRLFFSTSLKDAMQDSFVLMIAVGTPESPNGEANLEYVYSVAKEIGESLGKESIIVDKSTVPVGTADKVNW